MQRYALARAPATNRVFVLWGWAGVFEGGVGFRGPRSEAECAQERSDQLDLRLLPTKSSAWLCPLVVFPVSCTLGAPKQNVAFLKKYHCSPCATVVFFKKATFCFGVGVVRLDTTPG